MKIRIESALWHNLEDLIKHYPQLRRFGLAVDKQGEPKTITVTDDDGDSRIYEVGCAYSYTPYIFLDSVAEVFELGKAVKKNLVFHDDQALIVIYDTYLE